MDLVVPLAGASSRFSAFTSTPKWALKLGSDFILEWSLRSIFSETDLSRCTIISLSGYESFLREVLASTSVGSFVELRFLDRPTRGQAETVLLGLQLEEPAANFMIWNGDSFMNRGWLRGRKFPSNFLTLTELFGDQWSFAEISDGFVVRTAEKMRISKWASTGLYGWSSFQQFSEAYRSQANAENSGEIFVAPLYNRAIESGQPVEPLLISPAEFYSFGTPRELIESSITMQLQISDIFDPNSRF